MLHKDLDSNYILVKTRLISVSDAVMTIILYKNVMLQKCIICVRKEVWSYPDFWSL